MRTFADYFAEVAEALADIRGEHAALEARMERVFRKGKVTDVDAKGQLYRQEIGTDDDGQPVKSPWVPYAQVAGARKIHSPPSVGQQMLLVSPDGDHEQGHGIPLTFSTKQPSPSQDPDTDSDTRGKCFDSQSTKDGKDARTFGVGKASIALTDGQIVLKVGDATLVLTEAKLVATAGKVALVGAVALGAEDAGRELALKGSLDSAGHAEQDNLATKVKGV